MLRLGLVGKNISHSKSQQMYEDILNTNINYSLMDYSSEEKIPSLSEIFKNIDGLSITSPYKTHFLDEVSMEENIKNLGAINCISHNNGQFQATNTDFLAVREIMVKKFIHKNIVIFGDGVMAKVTIKVLNELKLPFRQYSRKADGDLNKVILSGINLLLINTCSRSFEFKASLPKGATFWDYNYAYKPHELFFVDNESIYIDGLEMLKLQAEYALKFWSIVD